MKQLTAALIAVVVACTSTAALAADGLIEVKSAFPAKETMNRFEETAKQRGLNIFARIDHAGGASKIGKTLRPTELLIFGNPQGGTPLMECTQTAGIDLPLKVLALPRPAPRGKPSLGRARDVPESTIPALCKSRGVPVTATLANQRVRQ